MKVAERGILMKKFTQKEIKNLEMTDVAFAKVVKVANATTEVFNLAFKDKLVLGDSELQNELEKIYDELNELQNKLYKKAGI